MDTDSDIRLARRLKRDISQRGRDIHGVMQQYEKFVKPAFDFYIAPSMQHADIIVPRGGENEVRNVFLWSDQMMMMPLIIGGHQPHS